MMGSHSGYGNNGIFLLPFSNLTLECIVSDGAGWDHVSVVAVSTSGIRRTPSWDEMCYVKDTFWSKEETVLQYHPAQSNYVNLHPHVLRLWRPQHKDVPLPEMILV